MPGKLIAVLVLLLIAVVLNVISKSFIGAGIGLVLAFFLFRASHTARIIMIGLTVLGMAGLVYTGVKASGVSRVPTFVWVALAFGAVQQLFTLWALTRADVIAWMDDHEVAAAKKRSPGDYNDGPGMGGPGLGATKKAAPAAAAPAAKDEHDGPRL